VRIDAKCLRRAQKIYAHHDAQRSILVEVAPALPPNLQQQLGQ
jgi:hypothetical protein